MIEKCEKCGIGKCFYNLSKEKCVFPKGEDVRVEYYKEPAIYEKFTSPRYG